MGGGGGPRARRRHQSFKRRSRDEKVNEVLLEVRERPVLMVSGVRAEHSAGGGNLDHGSQRSVARPGYYVTG